MLIIGTHHEQFVLNYPMTCCHTLSVRPSVGDTRLLYRKRLKIPLAVSDTIETAKDIADFSLLDCL